jgi:hypothetical protein
MKFRAIVEYEYPIEHKPPVKAEIILHGDRVVTDNIKPLEQESKPMVEIDLYSVIKQKYIEREVLDKIRAEIKGMTPTYHNHDWSITDLVPISEVLKLVDKYKAETEDKE